MSKKISELPAATTPLGGTELLEVVQGGVNKKVAASDVAGGSAVDSVNGQTGVVVLDATDVGADPSGSAAAVASNLSAHIADTTDAHAASAISFSPTGTISATDVQSAIAEVANEAATSATETASGIAEIATQSETNTGTDDARIVTPLKLFTKEALRSNKTANFSIASSDNQTTISVNSGSNVNATIDQMSTDYFVGIVNLGAGQVSFVAGSGVTLIGNSSIPGGSKSGVIVLFTSATTAYVLGTGDINYSDLINKPTTVSGFSITDGVSVLTQFITTVGNVGTGDDVLHSYSLPAGTLANDGQSIVIESGGQFAANANNKRVRVKFGSTTVLDTTALAISAATDWTARSIITRTGAATQRALTVFTSSSSVMLSFTQYATPGETLTGAITISVNGEATSNNDVTATYTKIKKEGSI